MAILRPNGDRELTVCSRLADILLGVCPHMRRKGLKEQMMRASGLWLVPLCLAFVVAVGAGAAGEETDFATAACATPVLNPSAPPVLNLQAAVQWALNRNPELAALRAQHGI